jgi:hypothetical protein
LSSCISFYHEGGVKSNRGLFIELQSGRIGDIIAFQQPETTKNKRYNERKVKIMKKRILTIALTLALVLTLVPATTASFFNDVNTVTGERLEMLEYVAERGLFQGDGGRFNPFDRITNMQFITVMSRMANSGIADGNPWYQPHLDWAAGIGISGFDRDDFLTRDNMALWFYKYVLSTGITPEVVRGDTPAFTDIGGLSEDYQEAILAMYEWGITFGTTDGIVFGLGNAERIAIAVIIGRFVSRNMPDIPVLPPPPPPPVAGNTQGNLANGGSAAIQGDWIYYGNSSGELWKMKTDGTGKTKLADNLLKYGHGQYINVVGDWIYFRGYVDDDYMGIYKMRTDGTEKSEIPGAGAYNRFTVVADGWSYTHEPGGIRRVMDLPSGWGLIYRIPINDAPFTAQSNYEKILPCSKSHCLYFVGVVGDTVYYLHRDHDNHPLVELYKITIGETEGTLVVADVNERSMPVIDGDWVYYIDGSIGDLHRVRTDGTGKTTVYAKANNDGIGVSSFNVSDGWIYFSTNSVNSQLPNNSLTGIMRMRTDGTGITRLYPTLASKINIVGDWIFFIDNNKTYQIRTDGTGLREV